MIQSMMYREANKSGLRHDWPRIPLLNSKDLLLASAGLGRKVADLLDPETDVDGVTAGSLRSELKVIGAPSRVGEHPLNPGAGDLAVTAGWGHAVQGGVTMPGKGKAITRPYASEELAAIGQGAEALGLGRLLTWERRPWTSTSTTSPTGAACRPGCELHRRRIPGDEEVAELSGSFPIFHSVR